MFLNLKPELAPVLVLPCMPQRVSKENTMPSNKKNLLPRFLAFQQSADFMQAMYRCPYVSWSFPEVSEGSEQANQTLPLLDFLLNLVARGGDLGLCGQNSTQEARQRPADRRIERPAERALCRPEGQGLGAAVADHLLRTPASRVQHEAHHQQQAWRESTR